MRVCGAAACCCRRTRCEQLSRPCAAGDAAERRRSAQTPSLTAARGTYVCVWPGPGLLRRRAPRVVVAASTAEEAGGGALATRVSDPPSPSVAHGFARQLQQLALVCDTPAVLRWYHTRTQHGSGYSSLRRTPPRTHTHTHTHVHAARWAVQTSTGQEGAGHRGSGPLCTHARHHNSAARGAPARGRTCNSSRVRALLLCVLSGSEAEHTHTHTHTHAKSQDFARPPRAALRNNKCVTQSCVKIARGPGACQATHTRAFRVQPPPPHTHTHMHAYRRYSLPYMLPAPIQCCLAKGQRGGTARPSPPKALSGTELSCYSTAAPCSTPAPPAPPHTRQCGSARG
jgi:hypothetical protein